MVGFEGFYLFFRYTIRSQEKPAKFWNFVRWDNGRDIFQVITETELEICQLIKFSNGIDVIHGTAVKFKIPQLFAV